VRWISLSIENFEGLMKMAKGAPVTDRSHKERLAVADIRLCFSYRHTDAPLDGSNNFTRALREHVSRVPGFAIVDDLKGDYDVLFMNQLSRSPGNPYALSEIRVALSSGRKKKVVVRAINLKRNYRYRDPVRYFKYYSHDKATLDLLNMADFVIFQSVFQKGFFDRFGYTGKNHTVIHNGAAPVFLNVPATTKELRAPDELILLSSAMSTKSIKRQDIIAGLSLVPGVRVIHCGVWPADLDHSKVEMAGVLSHDDIARLYERGHYFLHPAIRDVCPNSLIEGLCAGLPAIYNPGQGSGSELGGKFGIPLDENDLPGTIRRAREQYERLATALSVNRHYYSIERAASNYVDVFKTVAQG
jgi:glycosyltransferase involved in cell wall biosynthesis